MRPSGDRSAAHPLLEDELDEVDDMELQPALEGIQLDMDIARKEIMCGIVPDFEADTQDARVGNVHW